MLLAGDRHIVDARLDEAARIRIERLDARHAVKQVRKSVAGGHAPNDESAAQRSGKPAAVVLEAAVAGRCDTIVTFNRRDFRGAEKFGIRISTPREFLEELET